jgi:hypothetical protein
MDKAQPRPYATILSVEWLDRRSVKQALIDAALKRP